MTLRTLLALTMLCSLTVCATRIDPANATNTNGGSIEIFPNSLTLLPGATRTMFVRVPNASDAVVWSASGGKIDGNGQLITYSAPAAPGNYTVTASRSVDANRFARVTVEVVPQIVSMSNIPAHLT